MIVNELGQIVEKADEIDKVNEDPISRLLNTGGPPAQKPKKEYTKVNEYKPTGQFIYRPEFFDKIEKKII